MCSQTLLTPYEGGKKGAMAFSCSPPTSGTQNLGEPSANGGGETFTSIEIGLFWPLARGRPAPTLIKLVVKMAQPHHRGHGSAPRHPVIPLRGAWGMCSQTPLTPYEGGKKGAMAFSCSPPTSGTQNLGEPSANGGGETFCRLKSAFSGLWPEVGLRRP